MNGFGQTPDLKCNSLSFKNYMMIDRDGKLNAKHAQIRNLNVQNLTVSGAPVTSSYTYSTPLSLDSLRHMFNGPLGTSYTVTLHWVIAISAPPNTPTDIIINELAPTSSATDDVVLNTFGPLTFSSATNWGISSFTATPTISPSVWEYVSTNAQVFEVHIQSQ